MVDPSVVTSKVYNRFSYALLAKGHPSMNLTVGVTSAHGGEGKTTIACNLAVSMALANERDTILVDFNFRQPRIHTVFGATLRPGLAEALVEPSIHVSRTPVKHLHVLSAGNLARLGGGPDRQGKESPASKSNGALRSLGLAYLANLRDVVYSLQREFDLIIFDMPPILDPAVPVLVAQQMHGLLVVVDSTKTTREDLGKVFNHVGKDHILGVILNRVTD